MDQKVNNNEGPSDEILLFYVDEDGTNEQVVLSTVENLEQIHEQELHHEISINDGTFWLDQDTAQNQTSNDISMTKERWTDEETKRLLIFYIDNKENFVSGATKKKHLWTVACKTMLTGKNPNSCEMKLRYMKKKYYRARLELERGNNIKWSYYDLCHKAFFDDSCVNTLLCDSAYQAQPVTHNNQIAVTTTEQKKSGDEMVEQMLQLYIQYKNGGMKENFQKGVWDAIAACLGEEDGAYWHKRFLNYKQHYLRIVDKRNESPNTIVNWQYLDLFDQIYQNDVEFQTKYKKKPSIVALVQNMIDWDYTETTVLVKYYFDCFNEFQDPTIPNNFLWNEVGRLLDKSPESCRTKYQELKKRHMDRYFEGNYDLRNRVPLAILFDNIISKEVQQEISKPSKNAKEKWESAKIDDLVQFFYDNIEMFKDLICHYVCFACIAYKLNEPIISCKNNWDDLKMLYRGILDNKREDSELQIDWTYIDLFDKIFDYGMDINLLEGYEKLQKQSEPESETVLAKKLNIEAGNSHMHTLTEDEEYDEKGLVKRSKKGLDDSKAIKILEYYLKNKDKFTSTQTKKLLLWEVLGKQIGMTPSQCAHRFRNFKQVYMSYVQSEIDRPEMPIIWPYYGICKKIFGYRAIKNKLKLDNYEGEEWSHKEIKQLIAHFSKNFANITRCESDISQWEQLATVIGKTETSCNYKFLELRKSYRKLKTMKEKKPHVKVSWKYFTLIDNIYKANVEGSLKNISNVNYEDVNGVQNHMQADEDFQCIIVMPEGQEYGDLNNSQLIGQNIDLPQITDTEETATVKPKIFEVNEEDSTIGSENLTFNSENFGIYSDNLTMEQDILDVNTENSELTTVNFEPNFDNLELQTVSLGLGDIGFANENIEVTKQTEPLKKPIKWTRKSKKRLLILYLNYLRRNKGKEIIPNEMWQEISSRFKNKTPLSCRKMFARLKTSYKCTNDDPNKKQTQYYLLMKKILGTKHKFSKIKNDLNEWKTFKDIYLPSNKVELALLYYLQHIEEFLNPQIDSKHLWKELSNNINEPVEIVFNKVNYLKHNYKLNSEDGQNNQYSEILNSILMKETALKSTEFQNPLKYDGAQQNWLEDEIETLLKWYLTNLEKFKNPKYVRSYLWMEVSYLLNKSPVECSRKMAEIRTQYRTMVKDNTEELPAWKFFDLCQKIYGSGKRSYQENLMEVGS